MKDKRKDILSRTDLLLLRQKGLTPKKIARMFDVPVAKVNRRLLQRQNMRRRSGVF